MELGLDISDRGLRPEILFERVLRFHKQIRSKISIRYVRALGIFQQSQESLQGLLRENVQLGGILKPLLKMTN